MKLIQPETETIYSFEVCVVLPDGMTHADVEKWIFSALAEKARSTGRKLFAAGMTGIKGRAFESMINPGFGPNLDLYSTANQEGKSDEAR